MPEKLEDLEGFVTNFFDGLPSVRIVCISLLGGSCSSLIGGMLLAPSSCPAWMLLSRFHSMEQPVIMLLPVDLVVEGAYLLVFKKIFQSYHFPLITNFNMC